MTKAAMNQFTRNVPAEWAKGGIHVNDKLGSLSGQLGKLSGVKVKSVLMKTSTVENENS